MFSDTTIEGIVSSNPEITTAPDRNICQFQLTINHTPQEGAPSRVSFIEVMISDKNNKRFFDICQERIQKSQKILVIGKISFNRLENNNITEQRIVIYANEIRFMGV